MSLRDSDELRRDLLLAKARDLLPLLDRATLKFELSEEQVETMDDYLTLAWFAGVQSGRLRMDARATEANPDIRAMVIEHLELHLGPLMNNSADDLDLTVAHTVDMWDILKEAWIAGCHTCETEMMALYLETQSDVTAEAQKWLEEQTGGDAQ